MGAVMALGGAGGIGVGVGRLVDPHGVVVVEGCVVAATNFIN